MMHLVDEPGTRRVFVSLMTGALYTVSYDGKIVTQYLDVNAPAWSVSVQSIGRERGVQSFAFHPQFNQRGTPGLREVLHLHRHDQHDAEAGLRHARAQSDARHGAARVDGEEPGGRDVRRRRAARALPRRAAVRQSQRRPDRLQPPGRAGQLRLRPAVRRPRRRRQRRRSVQRRAEPELRVRQDPAHRSARHRTAPTEVRHSGDQSVRQETASPTRSARSTRTACATRSASRGTRRTAACSSPTSARTSSRRSARSRPAPISAGTRGRPASRT